MPDNKREKDMPIGERLQLALKMLHLSQTDMAKKIGVDRSIIGKYITGSQKPSALFLIAIKSEFGINPEWLMEGRGDMLIIEHITGNVDIDEIISILRQNPDWINFTKKALKGGETAADIFKALSSLSEPERAMAVKMLRGLQH
jgi:transcriptional regulator with XRE-family HTH domain